MSRATASLSVDLDNQWAYLKTHGDPGWEKFPSYLDQVVPRILDFLAARGLRVTFFIVGQDAALEKNHAALRSIAEAGHEVGNHSFRHEPWPHRYSEEDLDADIGAAEAHLEEVTGQRPMGFRGPGYSLTQTTLRILARRGYRYDSTTLPSFLGPLARAYYFSTAKLDREQKKDRGVLFGKLRDGFRPVKPYWWHLDEGRVLEIPVTTMPLVKIPIHASYLLHLSTFSRRLSLAYFRCALRLCRWTGASPSLLLHPLDFLGADDETDLSFFPAMSLSSETKTEFVGQVIGLLTSEYRVVPMEEHCRRLLEEFEPPVRRVESMCV